VKSYLVRVDEAGGADARDEHTRIALWTTGRDRNVLIEPDAYVAATLSELPPRLRDLLLVAGALYAADARISRGGIRDAFNDLWRRRMVICLRVHDIEFWQRADVLEALQLTIECLTGDTVSFEFEISASSPVGRAPLLPMDLVPQRLRESDVVVLLSGGLDSLAACLEARAEGRRPLLVSHRPATVILARQQNVVRLLRSHDAEWTFPHISTLLNAVKGRRPSEFSQRSRAFLFGSLAAIATHLCGAHEIRLCDNGVVSLNLPPSGQCVGTTLSRSTHPAFLRHLEAFLRLVLDDTRLRIENTLLFRTKREVVQTVARLGTPGMIQETVSCAHTEGRTRGQPHCGTCTQCIDRRFATIAAEMGQHDLVERYEADIFTAPLRKGEDRTHAENYVRFAQELRSYDNPSAFAVARLHDFTLALPDTGIDEFICRVHELLQRHQADVHDVLEAKVRAQAAAFARGSLSAHCLLSLLGAVGAAPDPRRAFVARLGEILADSLPVAFRSEKPASEAQMQDVGEAALRAAGERLSREAPQTPFGTVSVRPDFSCELPGEHSLYVEFKLVRHRRDVGRTHGQIAQDLVQYPTGSWILFVVYDPTSAIRDAVAFSDEFGDRRERVMVQVIR
jgi:hypothetical protein